MTNPGPYPLHGGQLRPIAERFCIPVQDLLDFSANINPAGPPPSVLPALHASLNDPATLTAYPDLQHTDLRQAMARYAQTNPQNIVIANGFVPLLEATLRTLNIRTCLLPVPAFVEYRKTLERAAVEIIPHSLNAESSFLYDPAFMFARRYDAVLLANPQNPSGVSHDAASMRRLVTAASTSSTYVLLDEAFIDYIPHHSLTPMLADFPNLILFRSVTKFHAIPGLRVAYAIANAPVAAAVANNVPPWPVTTLAAHAVIAALKDASYVHRTLSENASSRSALHADLEARGLRLYPSAANFLLFKIPPAIDPDAFWQLMIRDHHIVLRSCTNYQSLPAGHFRAAVRTPGDNKRLIHALKIALL